MQLFEERLQIINQHEEEKADFIRELVQEVKNLMDEKEKVQKELDLAQYLCKKQVEDLRDAQQEANTLQKAMKCDPFVLVLIDGDITMFTDAYVQRGSSGGQDAARDLRKAVYDYFKSKEGFLWDTKIVIHVFANTAGLSKTYLEAKTLSDPIIFRHFVQGFNKEHALCHFTDAGDDKEAADNKVKEAMELFYHNAHCRHIMFAGSGDNSYAGFLRQYSLTDRISSRVVLIESVPFAKRLEDLAVKFETTRLQGLFRESKLETRRTSFREEGSPHLQQMPPPSYASTVKQPYQPQDRLSIVLSNDPDPGNSKGERRIFVNSRGQRVDQPIKADRALVTSLKPKKLCNRHFLTRCNYVPCTHSHEGRLSPAEMDALRFIARLSPCQNLYCDDPDCVSGHRCMQGSNCDRRGSSCWFTEEMHTVDTKIVDRITV